VPAYLDCPRKEGIKWVSVCQDKNQQISFKLSELSGIWYLRTALAKTANGAAFD